MTNLTDHLRNRTYTWRSASIATPDDIWDLVLQACDEIDRLTDAAAPSTPVPDEPGDRPPLSWSDREKAAAEAIAALRRGGVK